MTRRPVKSLYVFDIDDTLFRTSARARVVNTKGQVKYLSSEELKDMSSLPVKKFVLLNLEMLKNLLKSLSL